MEDQQSIEPEADPTPGKETTWRIGPFTVMVVGFALLANLLAILVVDNWRQESILLGLCFGQSGVAIAWYSMARTRTWWRLAGVYSFAILMGLHFAWCVNGLDDSDDNALIVSVFIGYAAPTVVTCTLLRWIRSRHRWSNLDTLSEEAPRFSVRHLLILTTILAIVSVVFRSALPGWRGTDSVAIVILIAQSVLLVVVVVELGARQLGLFWQLGGLALTALAGSTCLAAFVPFTDWDEAVYINAAQVAVLAVGIFLPQLDRYTMRITLDPREGDSEAPSPEKECATDEE